MTLYKVRDIQPNPFRDLARNPISKVKVNALVASINNTSFWENIVAREGPNGPELAYGHHRWKALFEADEYGANAKVNLIIKKLDDATMLRMMVNENDDEFGTTLEVTQESVRAVVQAYADGKIKLPQPKPKKGDLRGSKEVRYAPSFLHRAPGAKTDFPYTANTITEFLGWPSRSDGRASDKVYTALATLEEIEKGEVDEGTFNKLSTTQAQAVLTEKRRAKRAGHDEATQRKVASHVAKRFREGKRGEVGTDSATELAEEVLPKRAKPLPDIDTFARSLCQRLDDLFDGEQIKAIVKHSEHLEPRWRKALRTRLEKHAEKALGYAEQLED